MFKKKKNEEFKKKNLYFNIFNIGSIILCRTYNVIVILNRTLSTYFVCLCARKHCIYLMFTIVYETEHSLRRVLTYALITM